MIRTATGDDAVAIHTVLEATFRPYRSGYTSQAYAATVPTAEALRARLASGAPSWVALHDSVVMGTISALETPTGLYVRSMAVHPDARGSGTGTALLRTVDEFARKTRAVRMYLSTTAFLHAAIRMYERWGFMQTDEPPHDLHGTPLLSFSYHISLAAPRGAQG